MPFARTLPLGAPDQPSSEADPALLTTLDASGPGGEAEVSGPEAITLDGPALSGGLRPQGTLIPKSTTVLPRGSLTGPVGAPAAGRPRYEAVRVLGEGGMGEVLLARDQDIDRTVAIKRLRGDRREAAALLRFAGEIRTIGALQHPNIVPIYDVGVDVEGQHYFVMKYVEGETLENIIEKLARRDPDHEARFPIPVRVQLAIGLLHALEHAHAHGVLHRDIKPANVMVGPHGEVILTDWGIARRITPRPPPPTQVCGGRPPAPQLPIHTPSMIRSLFLGAARRAEVAPGATVAVQLSATEVPSGKAPERPDATRTGALLGTPLYMSPEQARGRHDLLDERSDLFSAAVVLGELLSLRHYLADRRTLEQVLAGVTSQEVCLPYSLAIAGRGVPHELMHVVLKGMHQDPELRWQSAREMIDALERTLSGDIWVCCPFTAARRGSFVLTRWVNEHPTLVTMTVLLTPILLVLLAAAAFVLRR
jgi:serine/threonine protein kinase